MSDDLDDALSPDEAVHQVWAELQQRWPALFNFDRPRPLAVGTYHDILKAVPTMNAQKLKLALSAWCNRRKYLKCSIVNCARFDLRGRIVDEVNKDEAGFAKVRLEILAKRNKHRKALLKSLKPKPAPIEPVKQEKIVMNLNVKSIKITIPVKVADLPVPPELKPGQKDMPITLVIASAGVTLVAELNPKTYRKLLKVGHPPESTAIMQGKLGPDGKFTDVGISVMPSKAKLAPTLTAA